MEQREILVKSTLDGTMQPSLFYKTASNEARPLLVGLHTWSYDRFNQINRMVPMAEKWNFNLLLPEFRGANLSSNPICTQACGSEYAKQDIKDAIDYVIEHENVDPQNVFLLGASGGGHMALLMAGFCPEYFKAVGAFVPITDLALWQTQTTHYAPHILACCESREEMAKRSPINWIDRIAKANVKLFHGKYDGVVPVSHSIRFFNTMMEKYPSASIYLDVFDGSHEMIEPLAEHWLLSQYGRKRMDTVTG